MLSDKVLQDVCSWIHVAYNAMLFEGSQSELLADDPLLICKYLLQQHLKSHTGQEM